MDIITTTITLITAHILSLPLILATMSYIQLYRNKRALYNTLDVDLSNKSCFNTDNIKLYTKKGDKGITSSFKQGGKLYKNIPKCSKHSKLLGKLDTLNSYLGSFISNNKRELINKKILNQLHVIQCTLLETGSYISSFGKVNVNFKFYTEQLENDMDSLSTNLSKLTNFILPSNEIHISRCFARECERYIHSYFNEIKNSDIVLFRKHKNVEHLFQYYNRLSDYLFTVSRVIEPEIYTFSSKTKKIIKMNNIKTN